MKALVDPLEYPSEQVLQKHLQEAYTLFSSMLESNHDRYPELEERWKYYNDGKSWLMNVSRKKKTLFWLSAHEGYFTVTFYINSKYSERVRASPLKEAYERASMDAQERQSVGIVLTMREEKDLALYNEALRVKLDLL